MAQITLTSSQMKAKGDNLRAHNQSFKSKVESLKQMQKSLDSMWDGDANTAFNNAFNRDMTQMTNFYNAIEKYVSSLEQIRSKYEAAEQRNVNTATKRNY